MRKSVPDCQGVGAQLLRRRTIVFGMIPITLVFLWSVLVVSTYCDVRSIKIVRYIAT